MSARNGDKARFGKQRKRKMAHRARTRVLLESLKPGVAGSEATAERHAGAGEQHAAEHHNPEHQGTLDSAAGAIGSALGSLAAKVRGVKEPAPVAAE